MKTRLLLLHGALGSASQFEGLKKNLQEQFEVYSFDFEGHGGHTSSQAYSMELFVKNTLDFLKQQNIASISIFGYSMGGYVALKLALQHPDKVQHIVTLGTKFDWSITSAEQEVKMLNPDKIEEKVPRFAHYLNQLHHGNDWKTVVHRTANMMLHLAKYEKLSPDEIATIATPCTIGLGGKDNMVTAEESTQVANLLPNARFVLLAAVPHPIQKVDSEALGTYITSAIL